MEQNPANQSWLERYNGLNKIKASQLFRWILAHQPYRTCFAVTLAPEDSGQNMQETVSI